MFGVPKPLLAFTAASIGFSILSKIFGFYYVKVFLDFYRVDNNWFQTAQVLFMIWNTLNDPLFAYVQDNVKLPFVKTRRHALLYGGPLFALVFLVPWLPWEAMGTGSWVTGVHLIVALCLYDTMYTFVGLAQGCLLAEISKRHEDRVRMIRWSKLGSFAASLALYLCEFSSHSLQDFGKFQLSCMLIASTSCIMFIYAGRHAVTEYDQERDAKDKGSNQERSNLGICRLTWQIFSCKNFLCLVTVNFCHTFHSAFLGSFMVIISETLAPPHLMAPSARRLLYGLKDLWPSLLVIVGARIIQRVGYYKLIRANFITKISLGVLLFLTGRDYPWILVTVMVIDGGLGSATFSLFGMCLADIAEEDRIRYKRTLPITSMVYGTNALIVKPVYSIAPMIVVAILGAYRYSEFKINADRLTPDEQQSLFAAMFRLVCVIPIVVGTLQMFAWSRYTLRETHIKSVTQEETI